MASNHKFGNSDISVGDRIYIEGTVVASNLVDAIKVGSKAYQDYYERRKRNTHHDTQFKRQRDFRQIALRPAHRYVRPGEASRPATPAEGHFLERYAYMSKAHAGEHAIGFEYDGTFAPTFVEVIDGKANIVINPPAELAVGQSVILEFAVFKPKSFDNKGWTLRAVYRVDGKPLEWRSSARGATAAVERGLDDLGIDHDAIDVIDLSATNGAQPAAAAKPEQPAKGYDDNLAENVLNDDEDVESDNEGDEGGENAWDTF